MARKVKMAASVVSSLWWEVATSLGRVLNHQDFELDIDWSTHGQLNVLAVGSGACEIGVTMPPFLDWAMRRKGPLSDADVPKLCVLAAVNESMWLVAAVDQASGLRTLRELGEARYPWKPIMYPPGGELVGEYSERILDLHGFSREALKSWGGNDPAPLRSIEGVPITKDILVDTQRGYGKELAEKDLATGLFIFVNLTSPLACDLCSRRELTFLKIDDDALATVIEEFGAERLTLPARLFPGVDHDLPTIGWRHQYIYGREDTDPDLVRAILSALENPEFLDNSQGISYTALAPDLIPGVELHPAAAEWYQSRRRDAANATS